MRARTVTSLLIALAVLVALPALSSASTTTRVQTAAKRAASHYTQRHLGVSGRASDWRAACAHHAYGWRCRVRFNGGQCAGYVRLHRTAGGRYRADRYRIGCLE